MPGVHVRRRSEPCVLICGHESRDRRCGVLGPILRDEFLRFLPESDSHSGDQSLALVSHIGGHKWAGNAVIYLPPDYRLPNGQRSPLAGKGIWYGRVAPRHVEGIVSETIHKGRVIEELLRGVHDGLPSRNNQIS